MTENKYKDPNSGPCYFCEAKLGEPCLSDCKMSHRIPEVDILRSKVDALTRRISRMVEPKNPKYVYFEMDEEMQDEAEKWLTEHKKTCKVHQPGAYHGAIGGVISYTFCATSIGMLCTIKCACGEKADCSGTL